MKKFLLVCLIIATVCSFNCIGEVRAPLPEEFLSKSIVLMDAYTGEILYAKNPDTRREPASTTKIMTLLVSIEKCKGSQIVTVPKCASDITLDSTRVPVYPGEQMPLVDLWYGLIYKSGNDAANAIAYITSGSINAFVDDMNLKAEQLGMTGTHFANAHGLHNAQHYTTARDMAILTFYALNSDLFREITFSTSYTMQATSLRDELLIDHHYGITDFATKYYYPYARGIKTGWHTQAGQCYVGAADKGDHELIVVLLYCGVNKTDKWVEAKKLFEYGFKVLEERDEQTANGID